MTITSREVLESQHIDIGRVLRSGRREFLVFDTEGAAIDGITARNAPDLPIVRQKVSATPNLPDISDTFFPGFTNLFCSRLLWEHFVGLHKYRCTALYEGFDRQVEREVQFSTQLSFQDAWRVDPTIPAAPGIAMLQGVDIGGIKVDQAGHSVPIAAPEAVIQMFVPAYIDEILNSSWAFWADNLGALNEETYLGVAPNTLKYIGTSVNRVGEIVAMIVHQFRFSARYHLIQKQRLLPGGDPDNTNEDVFGVTHAAHVEWAYSDQSEFSINFASTFGLP